MTLDSLLALLKSGVTEVTQVKASQNRTFARNPETVEGVAGGACVAAEGQTATPETRPTKSEVTAEPPPILGCTHATPVTRTSGEAESPVVHVNPHGTCDAATASRWWLIHYADRDPVEVGCCPGATHAEMLERYPAALAAEPFTPAVRPPSAPLTAEEQTVIEEWLFMIEETDPALVTAVLAHCRRDPDARAYFLRTAEEMLNPDDQPGFT